MKYFHKYGICFFAIILPSLCFSQTKPWLKTDVKEFEKLLSLFQNTSSPVDTINKSAINCFDFSEDTLVPGIWEGKNLKVHITQTSPYIKGTSAINRFTMEPDVPTGGPDSSTFVGINRKNNILIVLYRSDFFKSFAYIEGRCFSYKESDSSNERKYFFLGKIGTPENSLIPGSYIFLRKN